MQPGVLSPSATARAAWGAYRLVRSARRTTDDLRRDQLARIGALVALARRDVALYRRLYASDGVPGAIATWADVESLPTVDRADIAGVSVGERTVGPAPPGARERTTSGTSGHSLVVVRAPGDQLRSTALDLRRVWCRDPRPFDLTVAIGAHWSVAAPPRGRVLRWAALPLAMSTADMADALVAWRADIVGAPPHVAADVGRHLAGRRRLRAVHVGGQHLDDDNRAAIERSYGVAPRDQYGAWEVGSIAWQCAAGDLYHLDHESMYVEVLDDERRPVAPGGTGDVVVTSLTNDHMPFIRYRIGDRARVADRACACGYAQPALAALDGRRMDWFVAGDGTPVVPQQLIIRRLVGTEAPPSLRRYQVRQAADRSVVLVLDVVLPFPPELAARLLDGYRRVFGPGVAVEIAYEPLADAPSGKFAQFVSAAAPAADDRAFGQLGGA